MRRGSIFRGTGLLQKASGMSKPGISIAALVLAGSLLPLPGSAQDAGTPARDWPTWGYDGARTGWNRGETTLTAII